MRTKMENTKLIDLFTGKYELSEEQELYYKMFAIEVDIVNQRVSIEDYKFFKENFVEYIKNEKLLIQKLKHEFLY